jgi:hypothetical protein
MRWQWAAVAVFAGISQAQIQEQHLTAGYALDTRSGALRAVRGIPGAARLGDSIPFDQAIAEAAVRNGRAVVISAGRSPKVSLLRHLDAAAPEVVAIDPSIGAVSNVYLNGSATVALLYSSLNGSAQLVTALDKTPNLSDPIPASSLIGSFAAAAVAETRSCALLASFDDDGGYLQQVCADAAAQVGLIARLPGVRPTAVSYFQKDKDALVTDSARNELLRLPQFSTGTAPVTLAGPDDGIDNPAAIVPLDSTTIAVMNRGSASLVLADTRQSGGGRRIELPESAARLEWLDGSAVLACTRIGPGPLLLIDARRDFGAFYVPMN